ncbi:MAG TPA: imidazole glycerol phosphate synthase subunit HisH [Caulobacterales bacterium]|nr:imidazole glycerol phosphate synthase subunit HisH [Caulobacterales bacterium]
MQRIAVIDYGAGNIRSVQRALQAAARQARLDADVQATADPELIAAADRIALPGQGAFGDCMDGLRRAPGVLGALEEAVIGRGRPFLGICVGMQLLAAKGLEHGEHEGLGWIGGICRALETGEEPDARVPQTGWNEAAMTRPHPVFDALAPAAFVYFNHAYVVAEAPADAVLARTRHGETFASGLARDNILGVQFHPEKSQAKGLAFLARFLDWSP